LHELFYSRHYYISLKHIDDKDRYQSSLRRFKEVAASLVLLFTAVSADCATTVPQIVALLFEQRKSATDLIEIFDVDVKAHD
jgi:hypothetical protein